MAYEFEYYIREAEKRGGSGAIKHAAMVRYNVVGEDNWQQIRSGDIVIPAQEVIDAMASGTNSQKVAAYKGLLIQYKG